MSTSSSRAERVLRLCEARPIPTTVTQNYVQSLRKGRDAVHVIKRWSIWSGNRQRFTLYLQSNGTWKATRWRFGRGVEAQLCMLSYTYPAFTQLLTLLTFGS